jgi:Cu-Zn family superoxide dismutase
MKLRGITGVLLALSLAGCSWLEGGKLASAKLESKSDSKVWGSVSFRELGDKVEVRADVRGLPPGNQFGFHVHEKGDCSAPDAMSAGGHFNPAGKPHGHPDKTPERHAGDMPNLRSDAEGSAVYAFETNLLTVSPGAISVVGKAVVIHAKPDDYTSQPAGNAGPRIACGLIRLRE